MAGTATFQVMPPDQFNFSHPEEWPKWARRFERFRKASGLSENDEGAQVNTLFYSMGDEADEILRSFRLSMEDAKVYDTVKAKFDGHFVKRRNVIYERAKFNLRQEPGESVDSFITSLYGLAEHCGYSRLHDEMIRDRIVVGLRDARLSEKLQLDAELSLDKAVAQVRQAEAVKQQQSLVRGAEENRRQPDTHVGAVLRRRGPFQSKLSQRSDQSGADKTRKGSKSCVGSLLHMQSSSVQPRMQSATNAVNVATSRQSAGQPN